MASKQITSEYRIVFASELGCFGKKRKDKKMTIQISTAKRMDSVKQAPQ
ncbi:hypothetical protein [Niastella yeongjuensis]|nr:hypothetical protein [Niastella yeongjuensis]